MSRQCSKKTAQDAIYILDEHFHAQQRVYPTMDSGVVVTAGVGDWELGDITTIVEADVIQDDFIIREVIVEDISLKDRTIELELYAGETNELISRLRATASSNKGGIPSTFVTTPVIDANSKISAALAMEGAGIKNIQISLRYICYCNGGS